MTPEQLKQADELHRRVCRLGGSLSVRNGRLQVGQPPGGLPPVLKEEILDHWKALIEWLTSGRPLTLAEEERYDAVLDPRQTDLFEDTHRWGWMLSQVFERFGAASELLCALRYLRSMGCRLVEDPDGFRLLPGDCPLEQYQEVRQRVLAPAELTMRRLLRDVPKHQWFCPATPNHSLA